MIRLLYELCPVFFVTATAKASTLATELAST